MNDASLAFVRSAAAAPAEAGAYALLISLPSLRQISVRRVLRRKTLSNLQKSL
ncbi:MAG: hypothetical protein WAK01_13230 [Methylocystis sp.]